MIKSWRSHERVMQKEWEKKNVHRYVGKPWGKRLLWTPKLRWEYNIKIDPKEREWESPYWIRKAEDMEEWWVLVNTMTKLRVPWSPGNFFASWATLRFWRLTLLYEVNLLHMHGRVELSYPFYVDVNSKRTQILSKKKRKKKG
jgi:hypothetical protein